MEEFKVNDYITLKLENGKTNIYVSGELFNQCKYILMRKTVYELENFFENIESVDELAEQLDQSLEGVEPEMIDISAETRFWVHNSNMQVWIENNYDTRLLHSNLAFPLLKKITECGDRNAQKVFKEEIAKRIINGNIKATIYIFLEHYIDYLDNEELESAIIDSRIFEKILKVMMEGSNEKNIFEDFLMILKILKEREILQEFIIKKMTNIVSCLIKYSKNNNEEYLIFSILKLLKDISNGENLIILKIKEEIFNLFESSQFNIFFKLLQYGFYEYLKKEDFKFLLKNSNSSFKENLITLRHKVSETDKIKIIVQFFSYLNWLDDDFKSLVLDENFSIFEMIYLIFKNNKSLIIEDFIQTIFWISKEDHKIFKKIVLNPKLNFIYYLIKILSVDLEGYIAETIFEIFEKLKLSFKSILENEIFKIYLMNSFDIFYLFLQDQLYKYLNNDDLKSLFTLKNSYLKKNLIKLLNKNLSDKNDLDIITQFFKNAHNRINSIYIIEFIDKLPKKLNHLIKSELEGIIDIM